MSEIKEQFIEDSLKPVSIEQTEIILEQMKNSIYIIKGKEKELNLGFFCHIKYNNKDIPVLITSYQIINERYLSNNDKINIISISFLNLVRKMKEMRMHLVEREDQYKLIYEFVSKFLQDRNK